MRFLDRAEAGQALAAQLAARGYDPSAIVLGLPRGGIPVAFEVAQRLGLPLDVFVVRKLGFPGQEEFAMGAIASGNTVVLDHDVIHRAALRAEIIEDTVQRERLELERREQAYRDDRPRPSLAGKTVILVDDGLATGSTMRAAVRAVRKESPGKIIVAVPVGAEDTCRILKKEADDVVCAMTPEPFRAVGLWYQNFTQTSDDEVREYLHRAHMQRVQGAAGSRPTDAGAGNQAIS